MMTSRTCFFYVSLAFSSNYIYPADHLFLKDNSKDDFKKANQKKTEVVKAMIIPMVIFIISRCCNDPTSHFSNISTAGWHLRQDPMSE